MGEVCRIGLDIAKEYFQVHGVDKNGKDMFNRKLKRKNVLAFFANLPPCLVGLEACGGAHHWAQEISKLDVGHTVKLVSPRHVKPFVLDNKTDAADARAICEVVGRPSTFPEMMKPASGFRKSLELVHLPQQPLLLMLEMQRNIKMVAHLRPVLD